MKNTLEYFRKLRRLQFVSVLMCFIFLSTMTVIAAANAIESGDMSRERMSFEIETKENPEINSIEIPEIVLISTPILYSDVEYSVPISESQATTQIERIEQCITTLETECANGDYTYEAFVAMQSELQRLTEIKTKLDVDLADFDRWLDEHYYAAKTWMYLIEKGYSEPVAAGIIGNMMAETSGGTLNLKPEIYSSGGGFYGLCQWSLHYRPHVAGMSFEKQLDYLVETMPNEFKHYAHIYKKGFTYEKFLALEDPEEVAIAFAKIYERCGSGSYGARQRYAMKAYNYFVD